MTEPDPDIPFLTQWRLVRSAIEHENTLKSHRVTWFLATQLFLFTGFTSIFVEAVKNDSLFRSYKVYTVLLVVFSLGIYACILAWANLRAAQKMIVRLHNWWLRHCHHIRDDLESWLYFAKYGEGQSNLPPVNGMFTSKLHVIFDEIGLPKALAAFWVFLFAVTTAMVLHRRHGVFPLASLHALALIAIVVFVRAKRKVSSWLESPDPLNVDQIVLMAKNLRLEEASALDAHKKVVEILCRDPGRRDASNPN